MLFSIAAKLLAVCGALLALYSLYFVIIAVLGLVRRRRQAPVPTAEPATRFALVVAARNEAAVIGHLVDSLYAQQYPRALYSVIVAPNNCTDDTAAVAKAHGARIFTPTGTIRGKGEVLTQLVDKLILPEKFDAMCVFDADNLADENFLARMNDRLCAGAQVVQGFRDSKNPRQSPISGCYSICYWMLNHFFNTARAVLGLSALVNGSGFAVTRSVLERLGGWHTCTMTEDYEFTAQCVLLGERVDFCTEARIYDEQPLTFLESWKQRRRWATGSLQGLRIYGGKLFEHMVLRRSLVCFDLYLTFLTPPAQVIGLLLGALSVLTSLFGGGIFILHGIIFSSLDVTVIIMAFGFMATIIGSAVLATITVLLQRVPVQHMGKAIATYWVFLLSQTMLTLLSMVYPKTTWDPIAHTTATSLAQLKQQNLTR